MSHSLSAYAKIPYMNIQTLSRYLTRLDHRIHHLRHNSRQVANLRLGVISTGFLALIGLTFAGMAALAVGIFALMLLIFIPLVVWHRRIERRIMELSGWRTIKGEHLARKTLDWPNIPPNSLKDRPLHPLEIDLDLREVHRLLDTATSKAGSTQLREWLLTPSPDVEAIQKRAALVAALTPLAVFRDKTSLYGRLASEEIRGTSDLRGWLEDTQSLPAWLLPLLSLLAVCNIILFGLLSAEILPALWLVTWIPYALLTLTYDRDLFSEALSARYTLRQLLAVLGYIESAPIGQNRLLADFLAPLRAARPSERLRAITLTVSAVSLQMNQIAWALVNAIMPWDIFFARRLEHQKAALAKEIPVWLDVWHELEALSSLANFAALNPAYHFPTFIAAPQFEAKALGHPLIPHETRVNNDFGLDTVGQIVLITGSNMAGKSSFLRAIGVNLCLAYAGGVVAAESLEVGAFRLFTCIRVTDSLGDGISYFYAEVQRLAALLQAAKSDEKLPLFFLIDEIFRGTNNRERLLGSQAYIQALAGSSALGLVATHDLELVQLADENPLIHNAHFREDIQDGRMIFDHRLRSGPSPTTNALKIMQLAGLPVPPTLSSTLE